jgi:hypothetical protein
MQRPIDDSWKCRKIDAFHALPTEITIFLRERPALRHALDTKAVVGARVHSYRYYIGCRVTGGETHQSPCSGD